MGFYQHFIKHFHCLSNTFRDVRKAYYPYGSLVSAEMPLVPLLAKTISQAITKMTMVLIPVARPGSTHLMPTFASSAVNAAKNAGSNAYTHHIRVCSLNKKTLLPF